MEDNPTFKMAAMAEGIPKFRWSMTTVLERKLKTCKREKEGKSKSISFRPEVSLNRMITIQSKIHGALAISIAVEIFTICQRNLPLAKLRKILINRQFIKRVKIKIMEVILRELCQSN
jgi:hypothetical protein